MERAGDDDYWIYQVLQKGVVRSTAPRINAAKLAALFRPADGKPWSAEISGRLLSLAIDIREFAQRRAATTPSFKFRHLLDISVSEVRKLSGFDVWLTPNDDDSAHSDLTYSGPSLPADATSYTIPHEILMAAADALVQSMQISDPNLPGGLDRVEGLRLRIA
jgi:hypothetical protein